MDPLTPNKIRRLIHLAEDRSFTIPRNISVGVGDEVARMALQAALSKSTVNYESSSGILDLERVEAFGESGIENESLCKSTAFNPGEMTGRSTEADMSNRSVPTGRQTFESIEALTKKLNIQSSEVHDVIRHSYAPTDYSFHSKRDLTADEASLVRREAPLPEQQTHTYFPDSELPSTNSNLSVGAYFKNRCPEFGNILNKIDSPDRSALSYVPSISEVSNMAPYEPPSNENQKCKMNDSLDCIPVRQSRDDTNEKKTSAYEQQVYSNNDTYNKNTNKIDKNDTYSKNSKISDVYKTQNCPSGSKDPDMSQYLVKNLNPVMSSTLASHKKPPKPTDYFMKNFHSSLRQVGEDSDASVENSLSISKIADFLGKQSNVSVSDILNLNKMAKQRKQPLTELNMNKQECKKEEIQVTNLRDTRHVDVASSSGTVTTVIQTDKPTNNKELPCVIVTHHLNNENEDDNKKSKSTRSKSPSSKSHSTMSTVQENFISFKSGDSPLQTSRGDVNASHVRTSNIEYRELDKSVDWREVLLQKQLKQESLAKEQWAEIQASTANGYVGSSCTVNVTITTLTESWLTAKLQFDDLPNDGKDLTIELPRLPFLLSPGKTEHFTLHITSNIEINTTLPFTVYLRDASIDSDIEQKGLLHVDIKMPIIQAMSADGVNKIMFPPIQENTTLLKSFVLISNCPEDLQLDLSIVEGDGIFSIKNVQEIKKCEVNKVLMDRQGSVEDQKTKSKGLNKQLCRVSNGNALRLSIKFCAPKLADIPLEGNLVTLNGALNVNLIGVNTVLKRVDLIGVVGTANLAVKIASQKIQLTKDPTNITVVNTGTVQGVWYIKLANNADVFNVNLSMFELRPGAAKVVSLTYTGSEDYVTETTLYFEEATSGNKTTIELSGGTDKPKVFPIKTNLNTISWIKNGRKELSLKNSSNKKVVIRCYISGDGFTVDLPGVESRGVYCLTFGPSECRPLPLLFTATSNLPHSGTLHLAYEKNSEFSRKVRLFGCASGESLRWSGLVTYGDTALVRAVSREPIVLELYNKSPMPAFVSAHVHFNLQYACVSGECTVSGSRRVVCGRARHAVRVAVPWARVERRARAAHAPTLATLTLLTGPEITRRRILRVLKDESTGEINTSLLDDHLKVLAEHFEGEDPSMDNLLADFKENKSSLEELIGGLHELTAQIVLPQDFADENTIIITDDTVIDHHTLCD